MKVKRYFAANMRSALEQVRQEQGPDVVILSNRKVDGGIEILTAIGEPDAELIERFTFMRPIPYYQLTGVMLFVRRLC